MDKLKDPNLYISGAALATAMGGTIYANKRVNDVSTDVKELSGKVAAQITEVGKLQVLPINTAKLNTAIKKLNEEHFSLVDEVDEIQDNLANIKQKVDNTESQLATIIKALSEIQQLVINQGYNINHHLSAHLNQGQEFITSPYNLAPPWNNPYISEKRALPRSIPQRVKVVNSVTDNYQTIYPNKRQSPANHQQNINPTMSRAARRRMKKKSDNNINSSRSSDADDIMNRLGFT